MIDQNPTVHTEEPEQILQPQDDVQQVPLNGTLLAASLIYLAFDELDPEEHDRESVVLGRELFRDELVRMYGSDAFLIVVFLSMRVWDNLEEGPLRDFLLDEAISISEDAQAHAKRIDEEFTAAVGDESGFDEWLASVLEDVQKEADNVAEQRAQEAQEA